MDGRRGANGDELGGLEHELKNAGLWARKRLELDEGLEMVPQIAVATTKSYHSSSREHQRLEIPSTLDPLSLFWNKGIVTLDANRHFLSNSQKSGDSAIPVADEISPSTLPS